MKKLRPFTEADVTDESAFFMQHRQVLKALGISAAALSFPSLRRLTFLAGLRGMTARPRPRVSRLISVNPPPGKIRFL